MALDLQEMDIFAAERLPCQPWDSGCKPTESADLIFPSYCVRRTGDNLLKDCCRLTLKVERNLDKYAAFVMCLEKSYDVFKMKSCWGLWLSLQ